MVTFITIVHILIIYEDTQHNITIIENFINLQNRVKLLFNFFKCILKYLFLYKFLYMQQTQQKYIKKIVVYHYNYNNTVSYTKLLITNNF